MEAHDREHPVLARKINSMNLIESVEVAYFRSIYKERIEALGGTTIFFGRNDSGKSNFLRALNLFFEGATNPSQAFKFERDFNHARLAEAEASVGARKFVYIKVVFNTPSNWKSSLGSTFYVKKQWSINKQSAPSFETSVDPNKQHYLTRFLNKIKFYYVPAIKDRAIFEQLLGRVYGILSAQSEFNDSLNSFSQALRDKTTALTEGILAGLNLDSYIAPPTDLTELFKSLDFDTRSAHGDSYSLTLQRGDGLQVRHIPAILAFLSDNGPEDFHIWGFEEPENSLELANAIAEAETFRSYGESNNKQIFITSHSPAFFRMTYSGVKRYFVKKALLPGLSKESSVLTLVDGLSPDHLPADLMGETPHLAIMSSYLDEASKKISGLQDLADHLVAKANESRVPIVFLEGESDKVVLQAAWDHYVGHDHAIRFVPCNGTTKMQGLAANGAIIVNLAPDRRTCVLVDNDGEGRSLYSNGRLGPRGGKWIQHNSNKTYWCRLFAPDQFVEEMTRLGIPENKWPGTLENIFPREVRMNAYADGAYELSDVPFSDLIESAVFGRIARLLQAQPIDKMYVMAPQEEAKITFANWLADKARTDMSILMPLRELVLGLYSLVGGPHGQAT